MDLQEQRASESISEIACREAQIRGGGRSGGANRRGYTRLRPFFQSSWSEAKLFQIDLKFASSPGKLPVPGNLSQALDLARLGLDGVAWAWHPRPVSNQTSPMSEAL